MSYHIKPTHCPMGSTVTLPHNVLNQPAQHNKMAKWTSHYPWCRLPNQFPESKSIWCRERESVLLPRVLCISCWYTLTKSEESWVGDWGRGYSWGKLKADHKFHHYMRSWCYWFRLKVFSGLKLQKWVYFSQLSIVNCQCSWEDIGYT